jgi:hypothetical protein
LALDVFKFKLHTISKRDAPETCAASGLQTGTGQSLIGLIQASCMWLPFKCESGSESRPPLARY